MRLKHLQKRFKKDSNLQQMYAKTVEDYVSKNYARELREKERKKGKWMRLLVHSTPPCVERE